MPTTPLSTHAQDFFLPVRTGCRWLFLVVAIGCSPSLMACGSDASTNNPEGSDAGTDAGNEPLVDASKTPELGGVRYRGQGVLVLFDGKLGMKEADAVEELAEGTEVDLSVAARMMVLARAAGVLPG
jgi:hypothetical protein